MTPWSRRTQLVALGAAVAVAAGVVSFAIVANSDPGSHGSAHPAVSTTSGVPSDATTGGAPPSTPPVNPALCARLQNGLAAANTYVSAAEAGLTASAQSCVYRGTVAEATTKAIQGKIYAPLTTDTRATVIEFASTDGLTRLTVTTAKESDGHFYVVGITRH
jgi:hypothetical protein